MDDKDRKAFDAWTLSPHIVIQRHTIETARAAWNAALAHERAQKQPVADVERVALKRAEMKLRAYIGVCKDDKELPKVIEIVQAALTAMQQPSHDYEAAMCEIDEIVRVARDNPAGLIDFLKANYPKQWGLSREEHAQHLQQPSQAVSEEELVTIVAEHWHKFLRNNFYTDVSDDAANEIGREAVNALMAAGVIKGV